MPDLHSITSHSAEYCRPKIIGVGLCFRAAKGRSRSDLISAYFGHPGLQFILSLHVQFISKRNFVWNSRCLAQQSYNISTQQNERLRAYNCINCLPQAIQVFGVIQLRCYRHALDSSEMQVILVSRLQNLKCS